MTDLKLTLHEKIEVLKKFCKAHKVTAVNCDAGFLEANLDAQLAKLQPAIEQARKEGLQQAILWLREHGWDRASVALQRSVTTDYMPVLCCPICGEKLEAH